MFVLPLKLRFSVPAARVMSTALPACASAGFQRVAGDGQRERAGRRRRSRLTSMPSAVAPSMMLLAIVNDAAAGQGRVGRRRRWRCRLPSVSPVISAGDGFGDRHAIRRRRRRMHRRAPASAGTRTVGEPLPLRLRGSTGLRARRSGADRPRARCRW